MRLPRRLCCVLLGLAALLLASCGGSGKGLIPTENAGPLQNDFEAVAQAAQTGNGNCTATATAIRRTQQDFAALPVSVDRGLHRTLENGISNLRSRALTVCAQPIPPTEATTTVSSSSSSESSSTSSTDTQTVETSTTQSTPSNTATATTPPGPGGGTPAPGEGGSNPGTPNPGEGTPGTGASGTGGAGQGGGQ